MSSKSELKFKLAQAEIRVRQLQERLMIDGGGGEPHYQDCCDYSDSLVIKGLGTLGRLEWMLRVVVGYSRRQDAYIKKLEAL